MQLRRINTFMSLKNKQTKKYLEEGLSGLGEVIHWSKTAPSSRIVDSEAQQGRRFISIK